MFFRKSPDKVQENRPASDDSLEELRKLLMGPMQERFDQMQQLLKMLENQELQAEEVSQILPEAILMRSSRDKQIVKAMEPITEQAIEASIQRDPRVLVSLFVPVMLPAIRKAIGTMIKEMIETFSATLEHGMSFRGLRWRYEAFKTKKPFGEVALLHSLVYQVEQIFLIHRETGLVLLSEVSKDTVVVQDADMVSGMLSAIQDFVRDSFGATQDDSIENMQFGDRSIWIEQTQYLIFAAVVWGNAPTELRKVLKETLNTIHFEHLDNIRNFDGNTAPFESAKHHLLACMKSQHKERERHPVIFWTVISLLCILIGWWSFFTIRDHIRWTNYLEKLQNEPGIVVAETEKRSGKHYVYGLRDSLASDPENMLYDAKIDPEKVRFKWELYHSSHPEFMVRRIKKILNPPDTIKFEYKDGTLWVEGVAPRQWIIDSKKMVEAIPGVVRYKNEKVVVLEQKQIEALKEQIEKTFFFFDAISTKVKVGQEKALAQLANEIMELVRLTRIFNKTIRIDIIGHTDSVGTEERNSLISQKRADEVFSLLTAYGAEPELFTKKGVASKEPIKEEKTEKDREANRCVNLKVVISDKENIK